MDTTIVVALVAQVPAFLLFFQSRRSSKQESGDRQAERLAAKDARQQELDLRRLGAEQAQNEALTQAEEDAQQRHRDRYVRFLRAAQEVGQHHLSQVGYAATPPSGDVRAEFAAAYEDALLDATEDVETEMERVKLLLDAMQSASQPSAIDVEALEHYLKDLRVTIRDELSHRRRRQGLEA